MSIRNFIKNIATLARGNFALDHAPDWVFDATSRPVGQGPVTSSLQTPGIGRPAENILMVFACLVARREAIGGVPLRITDANDRLIESGPLADLLARPNQAMAWDRYVRVLETYSALYDAVVLAKVRLAPGSVPDELVPLNPGFVRPVMGIHGPTGTPVATSYEYSDPVTGVQKTYQPDDLIVHFGFNPHAPLLPLSPLSALRRSLQSDIAAREQNLALFQNDATPKGVLQTDKPITKEQAEEISAKWDEKMAGYKNRHKTAVLWGGIKYEALGLTPAEMEYLEGLKFLRTDFYIAFRVRPAMLGEMTGETGLSQGSSTDSQKVEWWEDVGLAELDMLAGLHQEIANEIGGGNLRIGRELHRSEKLHRERVLRRSARPGRGSANVFVWFDDSSIPALSRHRLSKVDQFTKVCGIGYRPDDVNDYLDLGLPPHPDNEGRIPISLVPLSDSMAAPVPVVPPPLAPRADSAAPLMRAMDDLETLCRNAAKVPGRYRSLRKTFDAFIKPREKKCASRLSRFFLEQRERVLNRMSTAKRAESDDMIAAVFPRNDEDMALVARIRPVLSETLQAGITFFAEETGTKSTLMVETDHRLMAALERRTIQGKKINDTTEEALRDIFAKGFAEGASTADIGDRIAEYYGKNCIGENAARPDTAARTQVSGIVNEGRMIAARDAGGLKKGWLHGGSTEPREAHLAAEAKYLSNPIGLEEKFEVNGFECDAPGSTDLPIEEVANCSCMVTFTAAAGEKE